MTPQDIDRIKTSFHTILPIRELAASVFYTRLFELDPAIRPLFRTDLKQQGAKLMAALAMVVESLDHFDRIVDEVRSLGARHVSYGVRPHHYDVVGEALVWMLAKMLGDGFDADCRAAWQRAYAALSAEMMTAERRSTLARIA